MKASSARTAGMIPSRGGAPIKGAPFRTVAPAPRHLIGFTPGPKAVGSFVPKLARKAFEKFGFAAAAVLTDWREIVGPEIAACSAPERLRWPKPAEGDATQAAPRAGATLMLRVEPARALDVQYKTAQIVERINAYFGYRAVTEIRLIQAPLAVVRSNPGLVRSPAPNAPQPGAKTVLKAAFDKAQTGGIEDADLRRALERLGTAVSAGPHRRA
jgi:hypothetical protein